MLVCVLSNELRLCLLKYWLRSILNFMFFSHDQHNMYDVYPLLLLLLLLYLHGTHISFLLLTFYNVIAMDTKPNLT